MSEAFNEIFELKTETEITRRLSPRLEIKPPH